MHLQNVLAFIANIPADWIVFVIVLLALSIDVLRAGSGRITTLAISLPVSSLLFDLLPNAYFVGPVVRSLLTPVAEGALFAVLFTLLSFLIYRIIRAQGKDPGPLIILSFLSGLVGTVIITVVWVQTPALNHLFAPSVQFQAIFGSGYAFFWLVGSYLLLAFVRS